MCYWVEYFSPNLQVFHSIASDEATYSKTVHPIYQEVYLATNRLKNNKSLEYDGILAEFLKASGYMLAEYLHLVLQKVYSA